MVRLGPLLPLVEIGLPEEDVHPSPLVVLHESVVQDRKREDPHQDHREQVLRARPRHEEHREEDRHEQDGRAHVRLLEDQRHRHERDQERLDQAPELLVVVPPADVPREGDHEDHLHHLGRLQQHEPEVEPPPRVVPFLPDDGHENQHQESERVEDVRVLDDHAVRDPEEDGHEHDREHDPEELLLPEGQVLAGLRVVARGVDEDEGEDGEHAQDGEDPPVEAAPVGLPPGAHLSRYSSRNRTATGPAAFAPDTLARER